MTKKATIKKYCNLRGKEANFLALTPSEIGTTGIIDIHINECLEDTEECAQKGCKYAGGDKDPFR